MLSVYCVRRTLSLGLITSILLYSTSAFAAQKVVLKYGIFRGSLSVSELTAFAETGKISPALGFYLKAAHRNPQEVRQVLNQEVGVNSLFLSHILNSRIGESLLDQLSQAVHTPSGKKDREALRSSLVVSAAQDNKLTLIEVIQNYPTSEVQVEGKRVVQASDQLRALSERIQNLLGNRKLF